MNADDKRRMLLLLHAVEHFFFENTALQVVLTTNDVRDWKAQVDRLMADQENVAPEMHQRFRRVYEGIEQTPDDGSLVESLLRLLPQSRNIH